MCKGRVGRGLAPLYAESSWLRKGALTLLCFGMLLRTLQTLGAFETSSVAHYRPCG